MSNEELARPRLEVQVLRQERAVLKTISIFSQIRM